MGHAIQNVINVDRSVYLPLAFSFGKECLTQKHVELRQPFQRVAEDVWARLDGLKDQIKAHPYAHVLEPLIAQCGFNMMANAEAHAAVLNDLLNLVEDKKSSDPDWMPALVELLVSLFVDESHKTRTLVLGCFRQIGKDLTQESVQVIADAIDPEKDAALIAEEDDNEVDEESGDDREEEKMEGQEEDEEESEDSDDEDEGIAADADLDELKKKLAAAMGENGDAEESTDEKEDDDWTDEQMFAVDAAIGAAFKSTGKAARDERAKLDLQKRNFKLRVLDVIEIYVNRNSDKNAQFCFIMPLLRCAKVNAETPLSIKAGRILSKVMPDAAKKSPCKSGSLDELTVLARHVLYEMGQCQSSKYGEVLHQVFLFLLKSHKIAGHSAERLTGPIMKKLESFMTKAKSKMSVKFFAELAQRHPTYLLGALEPLSNWSTSAVNGFRMSVASDLMLKIVKSLSTTTGEVAPPLPAGTLANTFDRAVALLSAKKIKRDSVIAVNSNLLRFTIRTVKTLSTEEKGELEAKIVANRANVDIYQQKQELKSLSQLALNELKGQVGADEDATMDSRDKNAERQGRRDQKRAKKAEKEAKFLARMEEKKASGEWVEKTKWKAMERKTAVAARVVEKDDSDSEKEEETKTKPKRTRQRQQKKKKEKKPVATATTTDQPPSAKKARVEA